MKQKDNYITQQLEVIRSFGINDVILDIRTPDEQEESPLLLKNIVMQHLPFYKLSSHFATLDQSKCYLLYCTNGVMSRLQVLYLREQGFNNVKTYYIYD
ncbi:thiamine biosynthesis protein ThiI [Baumannia cicadellinicola str. Hc (Homalodisca coagulata)]|uniref:Thiamine biosynthesis protein ThiI n=2 Tax=Candidatus Palibaumannia cicadellinicola TaxID=186490 RepID=Q1LTJ1_BAUCH|nr:thiazole biosynthesis protein [Candidatus Baumannia cicadellinicola]ABF14075.1 thiamine biosynthesis protein ThiI [Baumannia cicadellinicola str. Hc (Homalodisca coagulata)]MBS0032716.1 hypothetical protein [Candidatus Baumannia cicadellinicola]MCJ7462293.1 hypothetical protein [Candidatus Baumannia cicadellinicola]MCJ7462813.1 hypothetical protein [Candidatus Baumannia cicadellinicola]